MRSTFEPEKDRKNRAKHGVSLSLATRVFDGPMHRAEPDVTEGSEVRTLGRATRTAEAERRAANVLPLVREIQGAGPRSLRGIAAGLDRRGVTTPRGALWTAAAVKRVLDRGGGNGTATEGAVGSRG